MPTPKTGSQTLESVAKVIGCTRENVRLIETSAATKIRTYMEFSHRTGGPLRVAERRAAELVGDAIDQSEKYGHGLIYTLVNKITALQAKCWHEGENREIPRSKP